MVAARIYSEDASIEVLCEAMANIIADLGLNFNIVLRVIHPNASCLYLLLSTDVVPRSRRADQTSD